MQILRPIWTRDAVLRALATKSGLPPSTDTPPFYGDFTKVDADGLKPMPVDVMVCDAIRGMARGRTEIPLGLSRVLKLLGRIAPDAAARLARTAVVKAMSKASV